MSFANKRQIWFAIIELAKIYKTRLGDETGELTFDQISMELEEESVVFLLSKNGLKWDRLWERIQEIKKRMIIFQITLLVAT